MSQFNQFLIMRLPIMLGLLLMSAMLTTVVAAPWRVDINSENHADMRTPGWENWQPAGDVMVQSFGGIKVTPTLRTTSTGWPSPALNWTETTDS